MAHSDLLVAVAVTFTRCVDTEVTVAVSTPEMSSETSSVSFDITLLRMEVGPIVSVKVVVSETCRVTVTVRGLFSVEGEAGQVLVARRHVGKRSGPSNQCQSAVSSRP